MIMIGRDRVMWGCGTKNKPEVEPPKKIEFLLKKDTPGVFWGLV